MSRQKIDTSGWHSFPFSEVFEIKTSLDEKDRKKGCAVSVDLKTGKTGWQTIYDKCEKPNTVFLCIDEMDAEIAKCLRDEIGDLLSHKRNMTVEDLAKVEIALPVKYVYVPDYDYMDSFMQNIMAEMEDKIMNL